MEYTALLILVMALVAFLSLGLPKAIAIALASSVIIILFLDFEMSMFIINQNFVTGTDSFSLIAVPFFIVAGLIMNTGGIAGRLIDLSKVLVGRVPGSLMHTNIVGNLLFGSISGSSVAAAIAMGGTIGPLQAKDGYDKAQSAAANAASAPAGLILPPTGLLIIFSTVSGGTSIAALFLAGYVPGLLWGASCMAVAYGVAKKQNLPKSPRVSLSEGLQVFLKAIPSLLLIVIIMGGITTGIFTATEASAIAVAYAFVLSFFCYRSLTVADVRKILVEGATMTGVIMFLIAAGSVMSWVMSFTGIPNAIANTVLGITTNPVILLLLLNLVLLFVGSLMDITPILIIFTPIFLPIVTQIGMDPVHFGMMMAVNLGIGNVTPPIGSAFIVSAQVAELKIESLVKPLVSYVIALAVVLLLVTFVPQLSLFLPNLLLN